MLKIAWGALFGNPLYALLGFGATLLLSSGFVGVKAYEFGADRERVKCQIRVDDIKLQIATANAKIEKIQKQSQANYENLEATRAEEARQAEAAEALANAQIGDYQDAINKRSNGGCLPDDDDLRRLQ